MKKMILSAIASMLILNAAQASAMASNMGADMKMKESAMMMGNKKAGEMSSAMKHMKADELLLLRTRPGVTQPVLLWGAKSHEPEYLIVFFPSSNGNIGVMTKDGRAQAERFYLLEKQRALFSTPQFAVAVIDTPSDRRGLGEAFRQSEEHFTDMRAVLAELKVRYPKAKVVLMGHSRGSVSAGYVSRALASEVDATVLLSARYKEAARPANATQEAPGGTGLSGIDFSKLSKPTLLVHHTSDACPSTLYADAAEKARYTQLVTLEGPADKPPMNPGEYALCAQGTNHWFAGQETLAGQKIIEWLTKNVKK
ncbi:MAG: alpha/beta fold hydrolase [Vibrionaceae bacterium]